MAWASVLSEAAAALTETYPSMSKLSSERQVAGQASNFEKFSMLWTPTHSSVLLRNQGAAAEDGRLKRGDQIMAVNGQTLEGVTHEEAVGILKRTKGTVTLTVLS